MSELETVPDKGFGLELSCVHSQSGHKQSVLSISLSSKNVKYTHLRTAGIYKCNNNTKIWK